MEACIAFFVLLGLAVIRQEDMTEIKQIEEAQENAPRKRRRAARC